MGEGDHPKEDGSVLYASEFNEVRRSAVNSFSVGAVALVTAIRLDKVAVRSYPVPVTMGWQVDALVDSSMRSATSTISLLPIYSTNYGLIELHSQKKLFSNDVSDSGDWTTAVTGDGGVGAAVLQIGGQAGSGSTASTLSKTGAGANGYIGVTMYEFGGYTDRTVAVTLEGATSGSVALITTADGDNFPSGVYEIFIASDSQTCNVYKNGVINQSDLDISGLDGDVCFKALVTETAQTSAKGLKFGDGTTAQFFMCTGATTNTWISSAITLPAGSKGIQVAVYDENGDFPSNVTVEVSSDNGANYTVVTENGKGVDTGNAGTQGIIKLTFTSAVPTDKVRMVAFSGCE